MHFLTLDINYFYFLCATDIYFLYWLSKLRCRYIPLNWTLLPQDGFISSMDCVSSYTKYFLLQI